MKIIIYSPVSHSFTLEHICWDLPCVSLYLLCYCGLGNNTHGLPCFLAVDWVRTTGAWAGNRRARWEIRNFLPSLLGWCPSIEGHISYQVILSHRFLSTSRQLFRKVSPPLPTQSAGVNIPRSYQPEIPCDLLSLFLNFSHSLVSSPFIKS